MEPLLAGDPSRIGAWSLVGRLWSAGPITSYRASSAGESVELQVMDASSLDPDATDRLRTSAEVLGGVRADGLQGYRGFGVDDGVAWLALDPVEGRTLDDVIAGSGPLGQAEWDGLAEALVRALEQCRDRGVVHGNVVPGAVLRDATSWTIANPGLPCAGVMAGIPVPGVLARSLMWLSPEQVAGAQPTPDSDLFAAGAVLALAATGVAPWGDAATPTTEVIRRISQEPAPLGDVPWEQAGLIAALTAKDPSYRLANVERWQRERAEASAHAAAAAAAAAAAGADVAGADVASIDEAGIAAELETDAVVREATGVDQGVDDGDGSSDAMAAAWAQPATQGKRRSPLLIGGGVAAALVLVVGGIVVATSGGDDAPAASDAPSSASSDAPSAGESAPSGAASPAAAQPTAVFTTKVNYAARSIPDESFDGTLTWTFDVCSGDVSLAKDDVLAKVVVARKDGTTWSPIELRPRVESPGRCSDDQVNLLVDGTEEEPGEDAVGKSWQPCVDYRVTLPESAKFAKTNVDFCVQVRAEPA